MRSVLLQCVRLAALVAAFLSASAGPMRTEIRVEAPFDPKGGHVQGMCEGENCYYLSQMTRLFKLDLDGRCIKSLPVISHTGDLCFHKGCVYTSASVYGGERKGQGLIQVYDADLNLLREKYYPRGMDGIACLNDKLYVGNGCHRETVPHQEGKEPQSKTPHQENDMAIVDPETLELERTVVYSHGAKTRYGAQNIVSDGKGLYISFYAATANDPDLVYYDAELKPVSRYRANVSNGFVCTGETNGCPLFLKCETTNRNGAVEATLKEGVAAKSPEVRVVAHRGGAVEATRRACEIAREAGETGRCLFICTGDAAEIDRFLRWADRYRCVTTNYPKWLLARLRKSNK